ncbi:MAG TPA: YtxH domain-containing protein [Flavobacteriales bacterium]|nr:YtxH domain-containing protein [Flavobacteriales bacterium]
MSNERNYGILGFLAGAAIGAAIGVLFAPRSGKETRERMAGKARATKDDLDEFINEARAEWAKAKGKVVDTATMTKEEVSDFVRFLFEEAEDLKERMGKDFAQSADEVADHARKSADHVRHGA